MRKFIFLIIVICFFAFGYLIIKGPGNIWVCKNGEWVKFGYLDKVMPDKQCGIIDTIKGNVITFTEEYRKDSKLLNTKNYSNQNLEKVPEELLFMLDTVVVNLSRNNISVLPEKFFNLVNIRELNLDHNNLSELPDGISKLEKLERLDLSHNNFSKLSKEIGSISNLRYLDISRNKLKELPEEFFNLKDTLENLDIVGNEFEIDYILLIQEKLLKTNVNF